MGNIGVAAPSICETSVPAVTLSSKCAFFKLKKPTFLFEFGLVLGICLPHAIGAMPGHPPEGGSDNYKCPEQLLQMMIFHVQESDLSVLGKANSVMVSCCFLHM